MRFAAVGLLIIALGGCAEKKHEPLFNEDPKKGRVVTRTQCFLSDHCFIDSKQCVGPDLFVVLDVESTSPTKRWVRNSKECA